MMKTNKALPSAQSYVPHHCVRAKPCSILPGIESIFQIYLTFFFLKFTFLDSTFLDVVSFLLTRFFYKFPQVGSNDLANTVITNQFTISLTLCSRVSVTSYLSSFNDVVVHQSCVLTVTTWLDIGLCFYYKIKRPRLAHDRVFLGHVPYFFFVIWLSALTQQVSNN